MIPIECPKCGRGGSVPPDRLNARLVCKACHQVFHLDNTGRMVLGEPFSADSKSGDKPRPVSQSGGGMADFDLQQTLSEIPNPVKFGVPAVILAAIGWLYLGQGGGGPDYAGEAESLVRALIRNDRSRVVSYSTSDSSEAAGQWYDLIHDEVQKGQISADVPIMPALIAGDAAKDDEISLLVVLTKGSGGDPIAITLPMKLDGGSWRFEATKGLEAVKSAPPGNTPAKSNRR